MGRLQYREWTIFGLESSAISASDRSRGAHSPPERWPLGCLMPSLVPIMCESQTAAHMIGMIKTILRHPAGTPASRGGKFKAHDRAEADISLDSVITARADDDVPSGDTDRQGPGRYPAGTPNEQGGEPRIDRYNSADPVIAAHAGDVPAGETDRQGPGRYPAGTPNGRGGALRIDRPS